MALASLLVAVIVLAVAIASAIYARRQAVASEGTLTIERIRHLEERRPQLNAEVECIAKAPIPRARNS
jgi:cell division protein FtsL